VEKTKLLNVKKRNIYYLGNPYPIETSENASNIISFTGDKFIVAQDFANKQHLYINKWLRREASKYITNRINEVSQKIGLKFNKLTIKDTKTRWGSCSYHNNININWKVIRMDKELLDYILVHELCHTKVKNHSSDFWKLVKTYIPNLVSIKQRLKTFERSQVL
jgi:predicted metal-dependent hydrolase